MLSFYNINMTSNPFSAGMDDTMCYNPIKIFFKKQFLYKGEEALFMCRGSPGGGHGTPLQYSCLENPMDRGAWRATVHRVSQNGYD